MSVITNPESDQRQRSSSLITFYKLLCPQCKTISVGDDVYDNWREGQGVTCRKCELTSMPETRKVDLAR